jgi:ribosome-associated protein
MSVEDGVEERVEEGQEPEAAPTLEELPEEVRQAVQALDERKGQAIVVLDMRTVSSFTDFMVICTGRSEPHLQALAKAVEERLLEQRIKPSHVEGKGRGTWVLMDFMQLIVHAFTPESRSFYQLEKLWRDAPMLEWGVPEPDPVESAGPAG